MHPSLHNAPAAQPEPPQAELALVPPVRARRRRRLIPVVAATAVVLTMAGIAWNTRTAKKVTAPGEINIRTATVGFGDLNASVRVDGVISAEKFAALMAPQVRGSRSGRGRGGSAGGATGSSSSSGVDTSSASGGSSSSSSSTSSSLGAQRGTTNRFSDSATVNGSSKAPGSVSGVTANSAAASVSSRGGGGGGGGFGNDFMLVLQGLAKNGIHVKKGDVVAEFDRQYQINRRDDYNDTVVQMNANIKKMKADLATAQESQAQQVRAAKAALDKALLDVKTIEVRSAIEAENFRLNVEEARARLDQAIKQTALLVESQRAQVTAAEIDRDQAKIELQRAENNVQKLVLKAPMDGIVVMQSILRGGDFGQVQNGDQLYPGQFFMQIVDPSSMVLNGNVNQVDAEKLRLGARAAVRLDAYTDIEVPATLIGVGAMSKVSAFRANYVGAIPVRLKLGRVEDRVIPDLTASADIVLHVEKETVITPRAGVFEESGTPFVFMQGPAGWIRKSVELGAGNHVAVAVRSGLRKGDVIALDRPVL